MHEKTLRTIGALVILAALVVVGITQASAGEDTTTPEIVATDPTPTTTAGPPTTESTVPAPFTFRVGILSGVTTDNFWAFYGEEPSVWNSYVLGPTKPALYTVDPATATLQPELAVDFAEAQRDEGRWQVRVELNQELAWSDGAPVTAHDLAFTFDTVEALDLGGSWGDSFPETVAAIEADGDHAVLIEFTERPRLSVWPHAVGLAPIMAKHVWEPVVEDITAEDLYTMEAGGDVSGGPLVITSVGDSLITSEANPGYPLTEVPDNIEYHVFADHSAATEALIAEAVDYTLSPGGLPADVVEELGESQDIELTTSPGNGIRYLGFNLTRPPMSERAFRHALALLLDRESLDAGPEAWSLVPAANEQWNDEKAAATLAESYRRPLAERLAEALDNLGEVGFEWETPPSTDDGVLVPGTGLTIDGQPPQPLTILTPGDEYDPARPEYAAAIAETLAALGFDARPVETDFDTVVDLTFTPDEDGALNYDMYMLGWTLGNPALPGYYRALFSPEGPMNNTGYRSEQFDQALTAYEEAYTQDEARQALWDMERVLARDLPYLLLYSNQIAEAYRSDRIRFDDPPGLGGFQARLGGIWDVKPAR